MREGCSDANPISWFRPADPAGVLQVGRGRRRLCRARALAIHGELTPALAAAQVVTLNFDVWSYSVDTIQDNIKQFEAANNGTIHVALADIPWNNYHETMVARLSSRAPVNVLYNGGDWLPEFARAGWVVPLEDHFPKARSYYAKNIVGYALQDMTYKGKMYGLPYYADTSTRSPPRRGGPARGTTRCGRGSSASSRASSSCARSAARRAWTMPWGRCPRR